MKRIVLVIFAALLMQGCFKSTVKPWEKGTLAKETMALGGDNPLIKRHYEHIFYSKEGTKGGSGVAGGGCGCN